MAVLCENHLKASSCYPILVVKHYCSSVFQVCTICLLKKSHDIARERLPTLFQIMKPRVTPFVSRWSPLFQAAEPQFKFNSCSPQTLSSVRSTRPSTSSPICICVSAPREKTSHAVTPGGSLCPHSRQFARQHT